MIERQIEPAALELAPGHGANLGDLVSAGVTGDASTPGRRLRGRSVTGRWRLVAMGAGCGAAWGVAARAWMRVISTDPAFTWIGSLFIVVASTIPGLAMGVVLARGRRWRLLGKLSLLPLCLGPGLLMVPTLVPGAMALARRRRQTVFAGVLVLLAVVAAFVLVGRELADQLPVGRAVIGFVLYLPLMAWLAAMLAVSLSPGRSPSADHGDGRPGRRMRGERLGADRAVDTDPRVPVGPAMHEPPGQHEVGPHEG